MGGERKTGVLACADKTSRFVRLKKLNRKTADPAAKATESILKDLPCKTTTNNRVQEFQTHERVADKLKVKIYFRHPYSSIERGMDENRIGVLMQYHPKKLNLATDMTLPASGGDVGLQKEKGLGAFADAEAAGGLHFDLLHAYCMRTVCVGPLRRDCW